MVRDALVRLTDDPLMIEWTDLNSDSPTAHPKQVWPTSICPSPPR
jgi:hypothetical protein